MKKLIALLATLFLLVATPSPSSSVKPPAYLNSIKSLDWAEEDEPSKPFPHCTTFSINRDKNLFLTAAHCIDNEWVGKATINGKIIKVVKWDREKDLSIIYASTIVPDLPLAIKAPTFGDPLHLVGFINGESFPMVLFGRVANPAAKPVMLDKEVMVMDATSGGGASGGPILNDLDQVVGVIEMGFGGGVGSRVTPVSGGVTYDVVKEFTTNYWRGHDVF